MKKNYKSRKSLKIAQYHFRKGNYKKSIENFLRCKQQNTKYMFDEGVILDIAICYFRLGNFDASIKYCNKSLDLSPSYTQALKTKVEIYEYLGEVRYEKEILDLKKTIKSLEKTSNLSLEKYLNFK